MYSGDNDIFNIDIDYNKIQPLFLGDKKGMVDTVNVRYPKIEALFRKQETMQWRDDEFPLTECNKQFKTVPTKISELMIKVLAWQWGADSIASHSVFPILSQFRLCDELFCLYTDINKNENTHARTYSNIVRYSFDDQTTIMKHFTSIDESMARLSTVSREFGKIKKYAHLFALNLIENNQDLYNKVLMFFFIQYFMERLQFVNSFAVTGLIALNGIFVQIGTPVQRISRDEIEIHASSAKTVIDYELKTERGVIGFNMIKNEVNAVLNEVLKSEIEFAEVILPNNEVVLGMHSKLLRNNAIWNAQEIYDDYGLIMPYERIAGNPVPELDAWFSSDLTQISPQEQRGGNYLLGGFIRDSASMDLSRLKIDNSRF